MTTMASTPGAVIGGVDTHADVHVAAAIDRLGAVLGTRSFPTTGRGYRQLLAWLRSFGPVVTHPALRKSEAIKAPRRPKPCALFSRAEPFWPTPGRSDMC